MKAKLKSIAKITTHISSEQIINQLSVLSPIENK